MTSPYRGEGHKIQPGCTLQAHYLQIQAVGDALSYAAQALQARELELEQSTYIALGKSQPPGSTVRDATARRHREKASYWYGVFMGIRGLLRAIEENTSELDALEQEMLGRIVWDHDPPYFSIPGFEEVQGQHNESDDPAVEYVGYIACFQDHGNGKPCRKKVGHA